MEAKIFLEKIKKEFPKLKYKKYTLLEHGWDHFAMALDNKTIFRTPKKAADNLENQLYNETRLLDYLKNKVTVGIPEYTYISKDKSFAGYKMLDGKELKPAQFKRLSAVDKEKIAKQLASFITSLHATPGPIIRKFKVQPTNVKKNYNALVRNARKLVFPKLKKNEIKAVEIFFDELKIVLKQEYSNTLIHTDLKWEHLLWNNKKKRLNIIDFSDREFGDPAIDFTSLWIYGNKFTHRVYELYNGKKDKEFLYRSQLYFKKIPILVMQGVVEGYPLALKKAHNMFKQRFKI